MSAVNGIRSGPASSGSAGRSDRRDAFTLIELLVVVAIISLLISILLPSLNRARDQAKLVQCLSQLRSLGMAAYFYSEDWSAAYPTDVVYPSGQPRWGSRYFEQIAPFVYKDCTDLRGEPIFECPKHLPYLFTDGAQPPPGRSGCGISYGYNVYLTAKWNENKPFRRQQVRQPATTVVMADHSDWDNTYVIANAAPYSSWGISDRHAGGSAIVFADNHAEHCLPDQIGTTDSGNNWFDPED